MKYRSMVPLNSAPSARPEPRVRYHRLSPELRRLCDTLYVFDGDTIGQVRERVEAHMKTLNDNQRRILLLQIVALTKEIT